MSDCLILVGRAGSGKGTLAKSLNGFEHVSSSDLLRKHGCDIVRSQISKGNQVPEYLAQPILINAIKGLDQKDRVVLDGVIRSMAQMNAILPILLDKFSRVVVVHVYVPEKVGLDRIAVRQQEEGREDDSTDTAKERMDQYRRLTLPVLQVIEKFVPVLRVDNIGSKETVVKQFHNLLESVV